MRTIRRASICLSIAAAACTAANDQDSSGGPSAKEDAGAIGSALESGGAVQQVAERLTIQVWKSADCDCCGAWVQHLQAAGYPVQVENVPDIDAIKREKGIPTGVASCHTSLVGGYLVEGHVPADVIDRVLKERPDIMGVAAPGMPMSAPGMAVPGMPVEPYDIVAFTRDGSTTVYERR